MNELTLTFDQVLDLASKSRRNGFKWGVVATIGVQIAYSLLKDQYGPKGSDFTKKILG